MTSYFNNVKQKQEYQILKTALFKPTFPKLFNLTTPGVSVEVECERIITQKIGSGPILKHFIERMGIARIIDEMVETHPKREACPGNQCLLNQI